MKRSTMLICISLITNTYLFSQNQEVLILQPGSELGKDATISKIDPNIPKMNGLYPEFNANAWTKNGVFDCYRSLIDFDLSSIPAGAQITNATLYLYWNPTTSNAGHSTLSGSNSAVVQRITSDWNESTVTWNTQPTVTTINQVLLPASSSETQNYEINITSLVQDYHNSPSESFGFMLRLQTEAYYRSIVFASSDNSDSNLHPKLVVNYNYNLNIDKNDYSEFVTISPNPSSEFITVNSPLSYTYELYNVNGQKISEVKNLISDENHTIDISNCSKGTYLLHINLPNGTLLKKNIIVN